MGCTTFLKRLFSDTVKINKKIRNEPLNGICRFLSDFVDMAYLLMFLGFDMLEIWW